MLLSNSTPPPSSSKLTQMNSLVDKNPGIVDWNDGFCPSGANGAKCRMVKTQIRSLPDILTVTDNVLDDTLAFNLYESVANANSNVWGVYVTVEEAMMEAKKTEAMMEAKTTTFNQEHHTLAALAVKQYLIDRLGTLLQNDMPSIHGVAVWCLSAACGDQVEYHIDYAEMFRFQTNLIYPPMYGATLHVSNFKESDIEGGALYVNTNGLDHYAANGYKRMLLGTDTDHSEGWVGIPYRYNRGIFFDGNFPHYSTKISRLPSNSRRVIVGFNIFNKEIGPFVQRYPEHSTKFNRYVKVMQSISLCDKVTIQDVAKNPKLAALLRYLVKKSKEKKMIQ